MFLLQALRLPRRQLEYMHSSVSTSVTGIASHIPSVPKNRGRMKKHGMSSRNPRSSTNSVDLRTLSMLW